MRVSDEEIMSGFHALHESMHLTFSKFSADMRESVSALAASVHRMERDLQALRQEINRRFDRIDAGFDRIEAKLEDHEQRIVRLEGVSAP